MSGVPYDPDRIARFYDEYGEREWAGFDTSAMDGVGLEVHLRLLGEHSRDGDRVLDAGAGPGRFTLELARLGARVVVGDISPAQLELHAVSREPSTVAHTSSPFSSEPSTDASVPHRFVTARETLLPTRAPRVCVYCSMKRPVSRSGRSDVTSLLSVL